MILKPIGPGRDKCARAKFERQVKAFQMDNALHQDGIVGTQTFWFMADAIYDLKARLAICRQPDDPGPEPQPRPAEFSPATFLAGLVVGAMIVLLLTGVLV